MLRSYDEVIEEEGKPFIDAVLITHAHLDHCQYISMLDPRIPIYCSRTTKTVLGTMCDVGRGGLEYEFIEAKTRKVGRQRGGYFPGALKIETDTTKREIVAFEDYEVIDIDGMEIRTFPVDHSIPGATPISSPHLMARPSPIRAI
jgi:ribonuclease J